MDFSFSKLEQHSPRKWFVFVRQFHHGPFSEAEVLARIAAGRIDRDSYVWSHELSEWVPIIDVEPFATNVSFAPEFVGEESPAEYEQHMNNLRHSQSLEAQARLRPRGMGFLPREAGWPQDFQEFTEAQSGTAETESSDSLHEKSWRPLATIGAITLAVFVSAGIAYRFHQTAFPTLTDISRDDMAALQAAASESLSIGPRAAVAATMTDPFAPKIYVGTNEPEGTKLIVHVDGIESTLLDRARASFLYEVVVDRRGFASTPVIRFEGGQPLPRGEFRLSATCAQCAAALNIEKTVFLGGKRDADYDTRLAAYNEKLKAQASGEIIELGQLSETIFNQLRDTDHQFTASLHAHATNGWAGFDRQWLALQTQIEAMLTTWNQPFFENEVFYGMLYRDLKSVGTSVSALHAKQSQYFNGVWTTKNEDTRIALKAAIEADTRDVHRRASEFQARLAQATRLAPTANGRPRTDGL